MKLPDLKKTKLSTVSTFGVVSILGTAMIIIAIVAIAAIRGAGSYSLKTTKASIKAEAVNLLQENTKRKAKEYSEVFKQGLFYTSLLGDQLVSILNKMDRFNFSEQLLVDYTNTFKRTSVDAPYIHSGKNYHSWCTFWGNNFIDIKEEVFIINIFQNVFGAIVSSEKSFYTVTLSDLTNHIDNYHYSQMRKNLSSIPTKEQALETYKKSFEENLKRKKNYISQIYRDFLNDYLVITMFANYVPFNAKYKLIIGIDMLFDRLAKDVLNHKVPFITENINKKNGSINKSFIIACTKGEVLAMSDKFYSKLKLPQRKTSTFKGMEVFNVRLIDSKINALKHLAKEIKTKKYGSLSIEINNEEYLFCFHRMTVNDWVFGVAVPIEDLYRAVEETEARMGVTVSGFIVNFLMVAIFFMFILLIVVVLFFKTYLVKPIISFRDSVVRMGQGDLETPIKEKGVFEIAVLANSFNSLRQDLKKHMEGFKVETSQRQRRENELKTARQVQLSVLPKITSLFQNRGIQLYAKLLPAIDVAGDYYDFFFVSKNKLVLIIADVSGKGISASFYMAVTKRTLRNTCISEPDDPAKSINLANKILCSYNINMFVTLFLVYYDMETGEMEYANGGHNEAVCLKIDGTVDIFGCLNNAALGCFPDLPFGKDNYKLEKGDTLYLYTDGIVEANTGDENFYGMDRFTELLIDNRDKSIGRICKTVIQNVHQFEEGGQFDDITILAMKRE
jgi:serine phosphatase RsbU (regulator of sigma subunit)